MKITDILKEVGIMGLKLIMFLIGTFACFGMLVGCFVMITQMTFWHSMWIAAIPSILFGIWCQSTIETDIKEIKKD